MISIQLIYSNTDSSSSTIKLPKSIRPDQVRHNPNSLSKTKLLIYLLGLNLKLQLSNESFGQVRYICFNIFFLYQRFIQCTIAKKFRISKKKKKIFIVTIENNFLTYREDVLQSKFSSFWHKYAPGNIYLSSRLYPW